MKLRTKILCGFISLTLIGMALGIVGLVSTRIVSDLSQEQDFLSKSYESSANVLSAHYAWRHALTLAVSNRVEFTGSTDATSCAMGQWLDGNYSKTDDPELMSLFNQVKAPHDYIHSQAKEINTLMLSSKTAQAKTEFEQNVLPKTDETIALIGQMEDRYAVLSTDLLAKTSNVQKIVYTLLVILIIVALVSSGILIVTLTKSIMNPIKKLTDGAKVVATGVLDVELEYNIDDEIGHLTHSFIDMIRYMKDQANVLQSLAAGDFTSQIAVRSPADAVNRAINTLSEQNNNLLSEIRIAAEQVSSGSQQVAQAAQNLAAGSSEQAATIEKLGALIGSVQTVTNDNTSLARKASVELDEAGGLTVQSIASMNNLIDAMKEIDVSSQSITKVIKVIDDIAFQTNILALNAAVEAARAGQHGKGFAVVADEVRNLASKSADAAKETAALIAGSTQKVKEGQHLTEKTNESIQAFAVIAQSNSNTVTQIAEMSGHQKESIDDINAGIAEFTTVVHGNAATAEQSAAAAEQMSSQSVMLSEIVSRFKLRGIEKPSSGASIDYDKGQESGFSMEYSYTSKY